MGKTVKGRRPVWARLAQVILAAFVVFLLNFFPLIFSFVGLAAGINYFMEKEKKNVAGRRFGLSDLRPIARGVVLGVFFGAGVMAPLRAIGLGFLWLTGSEELAEGFHIMSMGGFTEAWIGICGTALALIAGPALWARGFRLRSQIKNLPTSKARSAALGLAEFKGVAVPWSKGIGGQGDADEGAPGGAILSSDIQGENIREIRRRFYLEDETGRILVDPRKAEFWDGMGHFLWNPVRSIFLDKRYTVTIEGILTRVSRSLLPGDAVHLIGTVEENEEARGTAGADRLVVRPASGLPDTSFWREILFGREGTARGTDIHHVFFLTDVMEHDAAAVISRQMRVLLAWTAVWTAMSLPLAVIYREHLWAFDRLLRLLMSTVVG